tara:strand:+ start:532 stop:762 length:231 start_codon:yes stop_codon:yes gene_type:complete
MKGLGKSKACHLGASSSFGLQSPRMEGCNPYLGIASHATRLGPVSVATIIKALGGVEIVWKHWYAGLAFGVTIMLE